MGSDDVDALFKVPLGEFTSARNALAARLKKAGQATAAAEAKALRKPSVSAWVINQLYWRHGDAFKRLLDAGEDLRQAQATRQPGNLARELAGARRDALSELSAVAEDILRDGGQGATRDLLRRVTSSLEALSAYGSLPGAPSAGRLTDEVEPPGFETLAGLVPPSGGTKLGARKSPPGARPPGAQSAAKRGRTVDLFDAAARRREAQQRAAAARSAVSDAERAVKAASKQAERAAAKLEVAAARAKQTEARRVQLEKQLSRAAREAQAAHEQARAAEADARDAAQAEEGAQRALAAARGRLEELTSGGG